jgi:predicted nucleic acid-binding protein
MVTSMTRPRVYLDTNVFIAAYETQGARSDHAWWLLDAIEDGDLMGVTSELTLAEILVRPMEADDNELVQSYQDVVSPAECLEVPAITRPILLEAAKLRSMRRSLRLPDAIHIASARQNGCSHFVSDDRRLPFAQQGLQVVQLGPHVLSTIKATL